MINKLIYSTILCCCLSFVLTGQFNSLDNDFALADEYTILDDKTFYNESILNLNEVEDEKAVGVRCFCRYRVYAQQRGQSPFAQDSSV